MKDLRPATHNRPTSGLGPGSLTPGGAQTIDPAECPDCQGQWRYRPTTDGDGRTSMVEDYFEVTEPCEIHK